jgi:hypothetical protein
MCYLDQERCQARSLFRHCQWHIGRNNQRGLHGSLAN